MLYNYCKFSPLWRNFLDHRSSCEPSSTVLWWTVKSCGEPSKNCGETSGDEPSLWRTVLYSVTAYHRKYVYLNTVNVIISCHSTARARRDMTSSGQLILNSVHPKLQPTHTHGLRTRAHRYKNVNKNLRQDILSIWVYICFNLDLEYIIISGINIGPQSDTR